MEIYTEAMQRIIDKRVNNLGDMVGYTVEATYNFINSDGNQHIGIIFIEGYWMLLEPVRVGDSDIEIEVIDGERFWHYDLFLLKKFGICSEEEYDAERVEQDKARDVDQLQRQFDNARKFLQEHPEFLEKLL